MAEKAYDATKENRTYAADVLERPAVEQNKPKKKKKRKKAKR